MAVQQISVFLENKSGSLVKVFRALSQAGIQLITSTLADTADYGVCRILCNQPDKAYDLLSKEGFTVNKTPVLAIALDDQPGRAADAIACFAEGGLSISYLYSFLYEGKGVLIFRTSEMDKAAALIAANGLVEAKL